MRMIEAAIKFFGLRIPALQFFKIHVLFTNFFENAKMIIGQKHNI